MASHIEQGKDSETIACQHLLEHGLSLIVRNFNCRMGELDLIMRDAEHLVFIEVRSRASHNYGHPAETITKAKQRRLIRTAAYFLQKNHYDTPCRFDVVAITHGAQPQAQPQIEWIKDAFQAF